MLRIFKTVHAEERPKIDLTNVDRDKLLECLWQASYPAAFFTASGIPAPAYDEREAKRTVWNGYVDYACGRCIKTQLYGTNTTQPSSCIPELAFRQCVVASTYQEEA